MKATFAVAVTVLALGLAAYAGAAEHSKKDIKMLNHAAAALQSTNPDLSARLKQYAVKESGEKEEGGRESSEMGQSQDDIQMLRDSAAALETSNPRLSKDLQKFADKEAREHKGTQTESQRPSSGGMGTEQPTAPSQEPVTPSQPTTPSQQPGY